MEKSLSIREPLSINALIQLAGAASISRTEQIVILRKMLYANENNLPLSLAVTGGLFIASKTTNRVGMETKPLKNKIANDPNYHLEVVKSTDEICIMQLWRRASNLWPFQELYNQYQINDWIVIAKESFTMEDAKRIMLYKGAGKEQLASRDTYQNFGQEMLHYRCVTKIVSLYGDGIFTNPPSLPGDMADDGMIINGELVVIPTIQELSEQYGHEAVLEAFNEINSHDPVALQKWLNAEENNEKNDD